MLERHTQALPTIDDKHIKWLHLLYHNLEQNGRLLFTTKLRESFRFFILFTAVLAPPFADRTNRQSQEKRGGRMGIQQEFG